MSLNSGALRVGFRQSIDGCADALAVSRCSSSVVANPQWLRRLGVVAVLDEPRQYEFSGRRVRVLIFMSDALTTMR